MYNFLFPVLHHVPSNDPLARHNRTVPWQTLELRVWSTRKNILVPHVAFSAAETLKQEAAWLLRFVFNWAFYFLSNKSCKLVDGWSNRWDKCSDYVQLCNQARLRNSFRWVERLDFNCFLMASQSWVDCCTYQGWWSRKSRHPTPTPGNFDYPTPTLTPTFSCIS